MRLKEIRELKRISQRKLAKELGLADTMISRYERRVCDPSIENLIKMADIFGVSVDTLVGHDANLIDVNSLTENQREAVLDIVNNLQETDVAKVIGFIYQLKNKN